MKHIIITLGFLTGIFTFINAQENFYELQAETITGDTFCFDSLKGKKVMIVNTASECGLTPQYEELEELYQRHGGDDFIIIGFPSNDFMSQEPGTNEEILTFCRENYGVSFQMMAKITVKDDDMHPVYQWLTQKEKNGKEDSRIRWNFQKYLIDESGQLVEIFYPRIKPLNEDILKHFE